MTLTKNVNVLLIEDNDDINYIINEQLKGKYILYIEKSIKGALKIIKTRSFGIIILDNKLPDGEGIDYIKKLKNVAPILFLTAYGDEKIAAKSIKVGAREYIKKDQGFEKIIEEKIKSNIAPIKIFIVHGHNELMKTKVARHLEQQGFEVIILHEQPDKGKTIIEKFEEYSRVDIAVILLSGDDVGYKINESKKKKKRARQNVIFELGYFIGKLGREKVITLHEIDVEIPSDYLGVIFKKYENNDAWKILLNRELKSILSTINSEK
ncbi:MAG: nucleotide-binding protein [Thermoplasmata archaeon]|nr:nucleotide-binding protein [Thermoplasmata archaeon]